mmetsp:Transcript_13543/g.21105  ORF Transcript_13543/g.21105 Transcript_13543/m.21105 type:complete len:213 (-) Transcript_13543:12704-13342(-)
MFDLNEELSTTVNIEPKFQRAYRFVKLVPVAFRKGPINFSNTKFYTKQAEISFFGVNGLELKELSLPPETPQEQKVEKGMLSVPISIDLKNGAAVKVGSKVDEGIASAVEAGLAASLGESLALTIRPTLEICSVKLGLKGKPKTSLFISTVDEVIEKGWKPILSDILSPRVNYAHFRLVRRLIAFYKTRLSHEQFEKKVRIHFGQELFRKLD